MTIKIISKGNSDEAMKPDQNKGGAIRVRKPTLLQENVIKITKETIGANGRKSKARILREAGASESVARHPERVFNSPVVKEELAPVIAKMRSIRSKFLDALDKKDGAKETAFNLTMMVGMLTKDSELLDGRPTEILDHKLDPAKKQKLDKLFKQNS